MFNIIKKDMEHFVNLGFNWILNKIENLEIKVAKYVSLRDGKYILTPDKLRDKRALVNIQNHDDSKCLIWALLAHKLKIEKHADRRHEHEIILKDITCPVPYIQIKKKK